MGGGGGGGEDMRVKWTSHYIYILILLINIMLADFHHLLLY